MYSRSLPSVPAQGWFAALVLLTGCNTTTYVVQVDAISQTGQAAAGAEEPKSYKVHSRDPRVAEDSLRYNEVSAYIKTALSGRGLYEAASAESADLIIEIDYGMETPRMKYETVVKPIMTIEAGRATRDVLSTSRGRPTSQPTPVAKLVGWKEETEPVVVYEKYLKVSARANQEAVEGRPSPEIWSVNVSTEDPSDELRKYMPILASATADFIGTNTRQEKEVAISEGAETVRFIKKGM